MGAWIEIQSDIDLVYWDMVAPLVGAWIEIIVDIEFCNSAFFVAPLVGAWIEINRAVNNAQNVRAVAPLVGAWIEMLDSTGAPHSVVSLPLWERGLK